MGQRTQVLVVKESNKGEKKAYFFHHQWGFGRVMYLALMDLFMQDYTKETYFQKYHFLDCKFATNKSFRDISDKIEKELLDAVDVNDLSSIKAVFECGDNNNGGMVVYIKENETQYNLAKFKVGFLLGYEDEEYHWEGKDYNKGSGKAFERWLSPQEYGKLNGGREYSDEDFVSIFDQFCKYFEIEYFTNNGEETADK